VQFIPRTINFLGYAPYDPGWSFGQRLRAIRAALGLTQEQFAKRTELDEGTIAKWEREEHKPRRMKCARVVAFLDSFP